jgi:predicted O-linked N-acetylglucosamine transferase (SPINDLY family)
MMSKIFNLTIHELFTTVDSLVQSGKQPSEIGTLYNDWLTQNGNRTESVPAWFNFGVIIAGQGLKKEAQACYLKALSLKPDFWQAAANLANLLEGQEKIEEALEIYRQLLPKDMEVEGKLHIRNQMGRILENQRDFKAAAELYEESLSIDPSQDGPFQHWFNVRQKQCDWPLESFIKPIATAELAEKIGPIASMAYFDDPAMLNQACTSWIERFKKGKNYRKLADKRYNHERLRIGYLSCDFRAHAVCFLNCQMFSMHDRERFEIFGFDFSKDEDTPWRKMVINGFDHHIPIHEMDDETAAALIRKFEIDILVDLVGLTSGARPGILLQKPAPIQVSYLGFLGPVGMQEIDYIVCDDYVVPPEASHYYGAKPLYVPFYQVNNRLRIAAETPTRESQGLPPNAFVFCAINNSYKVTPSMFRRWMKILEQTDNSVLWLLAENPNVEQNIKKELARYGMEEWRVIFAKHAQPSEYLARFSCADLYLDASPYNAGITGSDAVWMGLPVLTCPGNTFVSRMASDLMLKLNLSEFVCETWMEYIEKAINFSKTKTAKSILERKLDRGSFVFDTKFFVQALERKFIEISR